MDAVLQIAIPGFQPVSEGKVRQLFDDGENLVVVTTDRISAFDCVLPTPIPGKGIVLNQLSAFWFQKFSQIPNHLISFDPEDFPEPFRTYAGELRGRSMLVRRAKPLPIECVVRGYLAGSGWKEYQQSRTLCGIEQPAGLNQASRLPEPVFTPTTKALGGHDLPLTWEEVVDLLGSSLARRVRTLSLALYSEGARIAAEKGIIIADTKFEFGLANGDLLLIDECLTPDSSRFWPADQWRPAANPPSFDKQYVRDYLEASGWNKQPPAPTLPPDVVAQTASRYLEAHKRLTGFDLG